MPQRNAESVGKRPTASAESHVDTGAQLTDRVAATEAAVTRIEFLCDEAERLRSEIEVLYAELDEEQRRRARLEARLSTLEAESEDATEETTQSIISRLLS